MIKIIIDTIEDQRIEEFHKKRERQLKHMLEPAPGYFITESPLVILRALKAGYEPVKILREAGQICNEEQDVFEFIEEYERQNNAEISVFEAEENQFRTLTGFLLTRGMLCLMKRRKERNLGEILGRDYHRIVVLDDVENPTNIGAIVRSAAALSIDLILLTKGCSDPLYRRASRVSMGCIFQIPWAVGSTEEIYSELMKNGYKTVAMALREDSVTIDDNELNSEKKLAIIMGNEGHGLPQETIDKCDYTALIPMREGIDSLNVAAASAVSFWQLRYRGK